MAELSKIKVELNLFSLVGQKVNNAECSCTQYNCTQTITLGWMTKGNKHDVVVQSSSFLLSSDSPVFLSLLGWSSEAGFLCSRLVLGS